MRFIGSTAKTTSPLAALALLVTITALAQTHPAVERGFKPELAYDFNGFDTVSLSNGNLMAAVPLGQPYPVGEGLSYAIALRYSGNLWNEVEKPNLIDPTQEPKILYAKRTGDNAGFGWRISFGELYEGGTTDPAEYNTAAVKWRYVTPDGGEHLFWETLHEPQCTSVVTTNCDPVVSGVLYTRDNSYLRLKSVGTGARVAHRNGSLCVDASGERSVASRQHLAVRRAQVRPLHHGRRDGDELL